MVRFHTAVLRQRLMCAACTACAPCPGFCARYGPRAPESRKLGGRWRSSAASEWRAAGDGSWLIAERVRHTARAGGVLPLAQRCAIQDRVAIRRRSRAAEPRRMPEGAGWSDVADAPRTCCSASARVALVSSAFRASTSRALSSTRITRLACASADPPAPAPGSGRKRCQRLAWRRTTPNTHPPGHSAAAVPAMIIVNQVRTVLP